MGRYSNSRLLTISSWFVIVITILTAIFIVIAIFWAWSMTASLLNVGTAQIESRLGAFTGNVIGGFEGLEGIESSMKILVVILLIVFFINVIIHVLFFIGLIKVSDKVKFSKAAGIFGLILILGSVIFYLTLFFLIKSNPFILLIPPMWMMVSQISITILSWLMLLFMILSLFNASKKFESGEIQEDQGQMVQDNQNISGQQQIQGFQAQQFQNQQTQQFQNPQYS